MHEPPPPPPPVLTTGTPTHALCPEVLVQWPCVQTSSTQQWPGLQLLQMPLQVPQLTPPPLQSSAVLGQSALEDPGGQQGVPEGWQSRPQWCCPAGQSLEPMVLSVEQQ